MARFPAALVAATGLLLACSSPPPGPSRVPGAESEDAWFRSGAASAAEARRFAGPTPPARNVILFVGDGMGISTITAARILAGQQRGDAGEDHVLPFERFPHVALSKVYSANAQVPDSAATMTAMLSGVKTNAYLVGLDERSRIGRLEGVREHRVATLLEQAEDRGLATGIVTTTSVTHATPAACYAHTPHRDWENDSKLPREAREADFPDIARQLLESSNGDGPEVVLGGGRAHFTPAEAPDPEYPSRRGARADGRNLVTEWLGRAGAAYVWDAEQLRALDFAATERVLGLFEPYHMKYEHDRDAAEPSLADMTARALERLTRDEAGFVLVVEGGRIDHGHHQGSAHRALTDTLAFADAVELAAARTDPAETLIVVTADHSHTLTIGGYPARGNPILGLVHAIGLDGERMDRPLPDGHGLPYTTLGYANGPGHLDASDAQGAGPKHHPHYPRAWERGSGARSDLLALDTQDADYLQESAVPITRETHAGEDVPIYARGPGAALFHGVVEQHFVYHALVEALGWRGP